MEMVGASDEAPPTDPPRLALDPPHQRRNTAAWLVSGLVAGRSGVSVGQSRRAAVRAGRAGAVSTGGVGAERAGGACAEPAGDAGAGRKGAEQGRTAVADGRAREASGRGRQAVDCDGLAAEEPAVQMSGLTDGGFDCSFKLEIKLLGSRKTRRKDVNCFSFEMDVDSDRTNYMDLVESVVEKYPPGYMEVAHIQYYDEVSKTFPEIKSDQDLMCMFSKHCKSKVIIMFIVYRGPSDPYEPVTNSGLSKRSRSGSNQPEALSIEYATHVEQPVMAKGKKAVKPTKKKQELGAKVVINTSNVPLDSPSMGTRSKKAQPPSPAMSTRSKRRLSL